MTEILQKDAASCMTVHDKVEVIIHHPQGHFSLKYRFHIFMYTCPLQSWFSSPLFNPQRQPILFSPSPLFLSGRHIKRHQTPLSSPFFIPTLTYFFAPLLCLSNVDIFKGATLSEMVNRCGTGSTHARLSRPKSHDQLCLLT